MEQSLDISWQAIIKVLITGFALYLLFVTRDIVIWFCFALIISLLVEPAVNFLRWAKLPKILAVVVVYLSIFLALGLIMYLTAPILVFELNEFSKRIPEYLEKISPFLKDIGVEAARSFEDFTELLISSVKQGSSGVFHAISTFFGGLTSTFIIFALAFFISLEERGTEKVLAFLAPRKYEDLIVRLFERAQYKVSRWFGARILSCLFVGVTSYATFYLLGIQYAFILALISGVMNFIPYIGPTITLGLAVLFTGVSHSWMLALYVFIALLVIQEIENKAVTPMLMKKFMDLPPVLVLLALLAGGIVFGFLGTIFAVPVFGIIYEFTKEFLEKRKEAAVT